MQELEPSGFDASKLFGDKSNERIFFLRKVYTLLTIQLLYSLYWIGWSMTDLDFHNFLTKNWGIFVGTAILQFIILILVYLGRNTLRRSPLKTLAYLVFTQLLAYNIAYISAVTNTQIVLMVVSLATLLTFGLLIYALTTKFDLTYLGGTIYVLGSALFGFEIFLIASDISFLTMLYIALINIIFGYYLIYDTQIILMGQSMNSDTQSSFVGSIIVYMDIPLIFFRLIQLLGRLLNKPTE